MVIISVLFVCLFYRHIYPGPRGSFLGERELEVEGGLIPWSPSSKSKVSLNLSSGLLLHVCILEHDAITYSMDGICHRVPARLLIRHSSY